MPRPGPAPARVPGRRGPAAGGASPVGPAHHPVDRLEQFVLLDRLEQVGVDPQLARPGQVAGPVPRGQQDDARGGQLGPLADPGGQGQAVGVGHAGVEQHQRVRPARADGVARGRPWPPRRRPPPSAPSASRAATPPGCGGWWRCRPRSAPAGRGAGPAAGPATGSGGVRLAPEPRREGEGAAPARLALHGDLPAHQGHQPGGDRQAQAGAAVLPRGRGVLLLEGPEDLSPACRAGCRCRCRAPRSAGSTSSVGRRCSPATSTRTTTSPSSVNLMALPTRLSRTCRSRPASPTRASGTSGCTWQTSSSPFLWARTARVRRVSPSAARKEKSAGSSSSLPASILEKSSRSLMMPSRLSAADLTVSRHCRWSSVSGGVEGQLGHAEDGVHGRADLVADVGQELVLGPVGRLRRLLGLAAAPPRRRF